MSQNPTSSTLFVSRVKAGAGIKVTPSSGTGIVTVEADGGGTGQFPVNTAITTAGAGTLTAAAIVGQQITRSGPSGAFTDTTDTAAAIVAAIPNAEVGQSFFLNITNTTAFVETLAAASGVTLSGFTVIPPNSTGEFLVTLTSLTAVTVQGVEIAPNTNRQDVNTNISTNGAGTLTGAAIAGGLITRSGSTAAFTDTTDTAANIVAAIPNAAAGQSFFLTITNTTAFAETLAADGGATVTLSGFTVIPGNSSGRFLVTITSPTAVTIKGVSISGSVSVPAAQFTTQNVTAGTLAAGAITGAAFTVLENTNATPGAQTVRTAAQMLADIPGAQVGFSYMLRIVNKGAGTLTLTADGGATVTITGTATVAQNVFRDYVVKFLTATTASITSVGSGVSP